MIMNVILQERYVDMWSINDRQALIITSHDIYTYV